MAPGDSLDIRPMLDFALRHDAPCSIRYPKASAASVARDVEPLELGHAEILRWGEDGVILCCGTLLNDCLQASNTLRQQGLDVGVVNARFVKPLDRDVIHRALTECSFVLTVEEGTLVGGFGSAVLEAASDLGLDTSRLQRMGIPDRFIEHGERAELLADLRLDAHGIADSCRQLAAQLDHAQLHRSTLVPGQDETGQS